MSRQLAISAAFSIFMMAAYVLFGAVIVWAALITMALLRLLRVASGERTAAERNGHHEFVPWRIGPVM